MKIWLTCLKCHELLGANALSSYPTEIVENRRYEFTCINGHKNTYHLQGIKYQILFESSFMALIQGFYLEAVLGFTASLERFYEFFCKFVCHKHAVENGEMNSTWKMVENQSERQFGAFLFLYAVEEKKSFDEKHFKIQKMKKFRNKVIHKGYLPGEKETVEYAELVFEMIKNVSVSVARKDHEFFHRFSGNEQFPDFDTYKDNPEVMPFGITSILSMTYDPTRLLEKNFTTEYENGKRNLLNIKKKSLAEEMLKQKRKGIT